MINIFLAIISMHIHVALTVEIASPQTTTFRFFVKLELVSCYGVFLNDMESEEE